MAELPARIVEPLERPVRLRLKFYVDRNKDYDLTGMLESTVNAIASVVFPPRRGGHKTTWNHEDKWVYEIEASKPPISKQCSLPSQIEPGGSSKEAYTYLPESILEFLSPEKVKEIM